VPIVWPAVIGGFIAFQVACALFGAYVAEEKNRRSAAWFFLCLAFGIIALIAVAGLRELEPVERPAPTGDAPQAWNPLLGAPPASSTDA
jgi:hypothetical protein